jgi:hypothetical protein
MVIQGEAVELRQLQRCSRRQRTEERGRKPLLLVGFAALPIRAVLFALTDNPHALIAIHILDGITASVVGGDDTADYCRCY